MLKLSVFFMPFSILLIFFFMGTVLVSVILYVYRSRMWIVPFQLHFFNQISLCGLVALGETTAHHYLCAAVANVLTLVAISPRQTILGMFCYTDSLTGRHIQLQSYIFEWCSVLLQCLSGLVCSQTEGCVCTLPSEPALLINCSAKTNNAFFFLAIFIP